MGLVVEGLVPYMLSAAMGIIWHLRHWAFPSSCSTVDSLLASSITFGAIIVGFLSTSKAIVASTYNSPFMEDMQKSGYIPDLMRYLVEAIFITMAFVSISFLGYFHPIKGNIYQLCWFVLLICSGATFARVTIILAGILGKIRA